MNTTISHPLQPKRCAVPGHSRGPTPVKKSRQLSLHPLEPLVAPNEAMRHTNPLFGCQPGWYKHIHDK